MIRAHSELSTFSAKRVHNAVGPSGEGGEPMTAAVSSPAPSYVIIRRGDNLWRIARRNYGRGIKYEAIYAANRDRIENPHWIFPGQVFVIPTRDRQWDTLEP